VRILSASSLAIAGVARDGRRRHDAAVWRDGSGEPADRIRIGQGRL